MYTGAMPGMTKGDLLGHEVCTSLRSHCCVLQSFLDLNSEAN